MDTAKIVYLEHLLDIAQQQRDLAHQQRDTAAAMCAEARRMSDRAGSMLTTLTATRSMLERQRSHIAVWLSTA